MVKVTDMKPKGGSGTMKALGTGGKKSKDRDFCPDPGQSGSWQGTAVG